MTDSPLFKEYFKMTFNNKKANTCMNCLTAVIGGGLENLLAGTSTSLFGPPSELFEILLTPPPLFSSRNFVNCVKNGLLRVIECI